MPVKRKVITVLGVAVCLACQAVAGENDDDNRNARSTLKLPRPAILPSLHEPEPPAPIQVENQAETASPEVKRAAGHETQATRAKASQTVTHPQKRNGLLGFEDILPLLAVLALIAVAAFVVKRFMPAKALMTGAGALEVVARLSISPKQTLVLVKMGRRLVLLGTTTDGITALSEVTDPDHVASLLGLAANGGSAGMREAFLQSMERESLAYEETDFREPDDSHSDVHGLLDKVRQMTRVREVA